MINNLRNALIRAQWTEQEVRTFRGAIKALTLGRGKARVKREE
jgi:tRNA/rRNA methyltransferase